MRNILILFELINLFFFYFYLDTQYEDVKIYKYPRSGVNSRQAKMINKYKPIVMKFIEEYQIVPHTEFITTEELHNNLTTYWVNSKIPNKILCMSHFSAVFNSLKMFE